MSDAYLRQAQRLFLQDQIGIDDYFAILNRHGAAIWNWLPFDRFVSLDLPTKVRIFLQRWGEVDGSQLQSANIRRGEILQQWGAIDAQLPPFQNETIRRGDSVIWVGADADSPSVAEVLHESLIAFHYDEQVSGPVFWAGDSWLSDSVLQIWDLIHTLRQHGINL